MFLFSKFRLLGKICSKNFELIHGEHFYNFQFVWSKNTIEWSGPNRPKMRNLPKKPTHFIWNSFWMGPFSFQWPESAQWSIIVDKTFLDHWVPAGVKKRGGKVTCHATLELRIYWQSYWDWQSLFFMWLEKAKRHWYFQINYV